MGSSSPIHARTAQIAAVPAVKVAVTAASEKSVLTARRLTLCDGSHAGQAASRHDGGDRNLHHDVTLVVLDDQTPDVALVDELPGLVDDHLAAQAGLRLVFDGNGCPPSTTTMFLGAFTDQWPSVPCGRVVGHCHPDDVTLRWSTTARRSPPSRSTRRCLVAPPPCLLSQARRCSTNPRSPTSRSASCTCDTKRSTRSHPVHARPVTASRHRPSSPTMAARAHAARMIASGGLSLA